MLDLCLPYPPSANRTWRMVNGRMLLSRQGRAYRKSVCALLATRDGNGPRKPPSGGRIALCMDAFPPDRRRRDLDNIQKPVLDALEQAGAYKDDSQIDMLVTKRCEVVPNGKLLVRVMNLPLRRCPVCGGQLDTLNAEAN